MIVLLRHLICLEEMRLGHEFSALEFNRKVSEHLRSGLANFSQYNFRAPNRNVSNMVQIILRGYLFRVTHSKGTECIIFKYRRYTR